VPLPRLSGRAPGPGQYTAPGAFNRRITFYTQANVAAGVLASAAFESWAAIRGLQGRELDKAQQIAQIASHLVTIPYQPGVQASMTIGFNEGGTTRMFQIVDIEDPDERHIELRMMCSEIGSNAGSAS
jgi:SPP1 family predicted phage head-tail adaptor